MSDPKRNEHRHYINAINNEVIFNPQEYISYCENTYTRRLRKVANSIASKNGNKIIMLAGPSSSGKTTSSLKLAEMIKNAGHACSCIHLDDFYKNRCDIPIGPNGKQDLEGIESLQLDLLASTLENLAEKGEARLPVYDFTTGTRHDGENLLTLEPGDAVIVEGIHALNPQLCDYLPADKISKAYVSVDSEICFGTGELLLNKRELRFLRRMIRDYNYRNSSVENTFEMWPDVIRAEEVNFFPFRDEADYKVDTIHPYEVCVYRNKALKLLSEVSADSCYYDKAAFLSKKLSGIEPISREMVPQTSLLNEFIIRTE